MDFVFSSGLWYKKDMWLIDGSHVRERYPGVIWYGLERGEKRMRGMWFLSVLLMPAALIAGFVMGFLVAWLMRSLGSAGGPSAAPKETESSAADAEGAATSADRSSESPRTASVDDLTQITGIGQVFAKRLHQAGIDSFAALAACTPEEILSRIEINIDPQRIIDDDWVGQAAALAAKRT